MGVQRRGRETRKGQGGRAAYTEAAGGRMASYRERCIFCSPASDLRRKDRTWHVREGSKDDS